MQAAEISAHMCTRKLALRRQRRASLGSLPLRLATLNDAVASGSSEALRRLRTYNLEDAYYKHVRDLDPELDSLKSLYGVKMVEGFWQGEGPMPADYSVPASVIAERLKGWQQGKQVV